MKLRNGRLIKATVATAMAATPMLATSATMVSAKDGKSLEDLLIDQVISVYQNLDSEGKDAIRKARQALLTHGSFDDLTGYVEIEGLTKDEKAEVIKGISSILYQDSIVDLARAVFDFKDVYDSNLKTHIGEELTFNDFILFLEDLQIEVMNYVTLNRKEVEGILKLQQKDNYYTQLDNFLDRAYDDVLKGLKGHKVYVILEGKIEFENIISRLTGISDEITDTEKESLLDAQAALIKASIATLPKVEEPGDDTGGGGSPGGGSGGGGGATPPTDDKDDADTDQDGEVVVGDDALTVESETRNDGKKVTKVTVDADKIADAVTDKVSRVKIEVKRKSGEAGAKVILPKAAVNAVKGKNKSAVVEIVSDQATYELPLADLTDKNVDYEIDIVEYTEEEAAEILADRADQLVGPVVEFTVTARTADGKTKAITRFNSYVSRSINLANKVDPFVTTGVLVDDEGNLSFVPSVFSGTSSTGYKVDMKRRGNSKYTVIKNEVEFTDIAGLWNEDQVQKLGNKMIVQGKADGSFDAFAKIKRNEFAALVARSLALTPEDGYQGAFKDVSADKWYADDLQALYDAKIISGHADGTYRPDENITRVEVAAIIGRAMEFVGFDETKLDNDSVESYTDLNQIAKWARGDVEKLMQADIMEGYTGGKFQPYQNATRAEMVKVLHQYLKFVEFIN
ncbi:S-layer homology domain-containing protein [Bacillaceae bacterium W0354]